MLLSIVIPCYNERENIEPFYDRTSAVAEQLCKNGTISDHEFWFIDDGSKDGTVEELRRLAALDRRVFYLSFTRNFGKEAAMLAGLSNSRGTFVTLLDADLQDPPELLLELFATLQNGQGYECVAARRIDRCGEPWLRSLSAKMFYSIMGRISEVEIVGGVRDFRLMTRRVVDSILTLREKSRFSKGLFVWAGYKTCYLDYHNVERTTGRTKWSFWKLVRYSLDGIVSFSLAPLQISSLLGLFCCGASLSAVLYFIFQKLVVGIAIKGYAMLVCAIFLLGGIQLLCLGVLGQYIGKLFIECKQRPDYLVLEAHVPEREGFSV